MSPAELHQYFDGERYGAMMALGLGIASICLASYVWFGRSPFRAMAWPLVIVAVVELGVGVGLLARTGPQVETLEAGLRTAPQPTAAVELQRMTRVNQSFRVIKTIEVVAIAAGVFLIMLLPAENVAWRAVGLGLLLQATALLVFDVFAEHRAHLYTRWLSGLGS